MNVKASAAADTSVESFSTTQPVPYSQQYVWYVVGLLTIVNVFNMMDRMALAVMAPFIKKDLALTDAQLGLLIGFSFAIFYAVCGIPIARLADRGVRRSIIAVALATWSVMTALSGAAQSFWHLFVARIGVGAGEAGCNPPAQSLLCDYVPYRQRAGVFSIHGFGLTAGLIFGMMLAGVLAESIGWRWTFVALGLPGIALALVVRFTLREPVRGQLDKRSDVTGPVSFRAAIGILLGCRTYVLITVYALINGLVQNGLNQWWASFYVRSFKMSVSAVGTYLGLAIGAGTALGLLLGGLMSNKASQRDIRLPFLIGIAAILSALPTAVFILFVDSVAVSFVLVGLTCALWSVPIGMTLAAVNSVVPAHVRATGTAIMNFSIAAVGLGTGPFLVGWLSDVLTPRYGSESLRYALLLPPLLLPLMAFVFWRASRALPDDLRAAGLHTTESKG